MEFDEAVELVFEDYMSGADEDWTREEVIAHVRNTISLDGDTPGSVGLVDYGDRLTEAYRLILTTA